MEKGKDIRAKAMEMIEEYLIRICRLYGMADETTASVLRLARWANQLPGMTDEEVHALTDENDNDETSN